MFGLHHQQTSINPRAKSHHNRDILIKDLKSLTNVIPDVFYRGSHNDIQPLITKVNRISQSQKQSHDNPLLFISTASDNNH